MQEGRKKLLDLLLEWGVQRPAQLEKDADVMQRTRQALDTRFEVRKRLSQSINRNYMTETITTNANQQSSW